MSRIATPPRHRSCPRRRPTAPHTSQTRRQRRRDRTRRRRQTRTARTARRQLEHQHHQRPPPARSRFEPLASAFRRPTCLRFVVRALATMLTVGQGTVGNRLRTRGVFAPGQPSSSHRVFRQRRWSCGRPAQGRTDWVVDHLVPAGPILRAGADPVAGHKGAQVCGKGCQRDPVRSTPSLTVCPWGHPGVVRAVWVRWPWTRRWWARPLRVALSRTEKDQAPAGRRHHTPVRLLRHLC